MQFQSQQLNTDCKKHRSRSSWNWGQYLCKKLCSGTVINTALQCCTDRISAIMHHVKSIKTTSDWLIITFASFCSVSWWRSHSVPSLKLQQSKSNLQVSACHTFQLLSIWPDFTLGGRHCERTHSWSPAALTRIVRCVCRGCVSLMSNNQRIHEALNQSTLCYIKQACS